MTAWVILIYGVLVAAGGAMGYVKAKSMASLIAGGVSGLLLVASAVAMMKGSYQTGWWLALIISILLLARFGMASLNGFKMMPGGLMIILSVIAIIVLLVGRNSPSAQL